jgi:hypothetical protein
LLFVLELVVLFLGVLGVHFALLVFGVALLFGFAELVFEEGG